MIDRPFWRQRIEDAWRKTPIAWLSGVRRCGKTTLAESLGADRILYINCDLPTVEDRVRDPQLFYRSCAAPIFDVGTPASLQAEHAGASLARQSGAGTGFRDRHGARRSRRDRVQVEPGRLRRCRAGRFPRLLSARAKLSGDAIGESDVHAALRGFGGANLHTDGTGRDLRFLIAD